MPDQVAPLSDRDRHAKGLAGRQTIGIRELKAHASAVIQEVKRRRVSYAVTRRGRVEAVIVPEDVGERLLSPSPAETAWDEWQGLAAELARGVQGRTMQSAVAELSRMRR
jgi:prevent-host-death family protein